MSLFVRNFVELLVLALWAVVLARVVVSWVDPTARNQVSRQVIALSEPFLAPIRRFIPSTGMFDLSPIILFVVLALVLQVLR